ncbi:uncharacterized protein LOC122266706 [Penaeus japonicus]|uniref:uncharacterized protein LOC122266706 n=1 Tax=Penaeus japonicus TaxID=27405 RepID=UPI001C71612F|nr:uncharacterized protein LOC122266706 [Penaeus japonicus]
MSVKEEAEKKFLIEVLGVCRTLPALWRIKLDDYNNRAKKAEAYDILLQKYREHFTSATLEDLKKKKKNLRTNFRNELRKMDECAKSGAGTEDLYESRVWFMEAMMFLRDQETPAQSRSTLSNSDDNDTSDKQGTIKLMLTLSPVPRLYIVICIFPVHICSPQVKGSKVKVTEGQSVEKCNLIGWLRCGSVLDGDDSGDGTIERESKNCEGSLPAITRPLPMPTKQSSSSPSVSLGRKRKPVTEAEKAELLSLAKARLTEPEDRYLSQAKTWALELKCFDATQELFAKRAINDILFQARCSTLHRNSVQINGNTTTPSSSRCSTPCISVGHYQVQSDSAPSFMNNYQGGHFSQVATESLNNGSNVSQYFGNFSPTP